MTGLELIYLLIPLAIVSLFVLVVRRAANKQLEAKRRLGLDAPEEATAKRPPSEEPAVPKESAPAEQEPEPDAEEPPDDADERLRDGLKKTRGGFVAKLGKIFGRKKLDADILDELEQVLFTADIGPKTAGRLFEALKGELSKAELGEVDAVWDKLREQTHDILDVEAAPIDYGAHSPFVLLVVGVNGVGKTTTIGKVAARLSAQGHKVMLAAGDTFRAAAVEQLEVWGERSGCPVVRGKSGSDPSSVIYEAIERATREHYDIVIADTAGRLHTKTNLMDELGKVHRVIDKAKAGAPHETWLVLDATTGQNAITQATMFNEVIKLSGIVLTKLDGTPKGGVILGICDLLRIPVRFIGIGETVEDLRPFDPDAFISALYEEESPDHAA